MSLQKKLISDGFWAFGTKIAAGLTQILLGVFLARALSPNDFGNFQVLERIAIAASIVCAGGLGWSAINFISDGLNRNDYKYAADATLKIFKLTLIGSLITALIVAIAAYRGLYSIFNLSTEGLVLPLGLLIIITSLKKVLPECFRAYKDIKLSSFFGGLAMNLVLCIFLATILLQDQAISLSNALNLYLYAGLSVFLVSLLLLFYKIKKVSRTAPINANTSIRSLVNYKDIRKHAVTVMASELTIFLIQQSNVWIIAALFSAHMAGIFSISARLVFVIALPLMISNAILKPYIIDMLSSDKERLQRYISRMTQVTFGVAFIPTAFILAFPEWTLIFLYGHEYASGSHILMVMAAVQLINVGLGPCSALLILSGNEKNVFKYAFLGLITYSLLVILLIPYVNENGVLYALALGQLCYQGLICLDCHRSLGIKTHLSFKPY